MFAEWTRVAGVRRFLAVVEPQEDVLCSGQFVGEDQVDAVLGKGVELRAEFWSSAPTLAYPTSRPFCADGFTVLSSAANPGVGVYDQDTEHTKDVRPALPVDYRVVNGVV